MSHISTEETIISRLELVLPKNVLQTCISLQKGFGAEFVSTNLQKKTASRIKVAKEMNESVRLTVSISRLQFDVPIRPEHILIQNLRGKAVSDITQQATTNDASDVKTSSSKSFSQNPDGVETIGGDQFSSNMSTPAVSNEALGYSADGNNQACQEVKGKGDSKCQVTTAELESLNNTIVDEIEPLISNENPEVEITNHNHDSSETDQSNLTQSMQLPNSMNDTNVINVDGRNSTKATGLVQKNGTVIKQTIPKTKEVLRLTSEPKRLLKSDRSNMKRPNYKREKNVQCNYCDVKLKDLDGLFVHTKLKHSHVKGYKELISRLRDTIKVTCCVCHKIYSRKDQLNVHMNLVHGLPKAVDCPKCNVRVKSEQHLRDHIRRIHNNTGRMHLCHLCPASFRVPAYLSAHLKYVHTNNKEDAFPCNQCDKTYSSEKYLRNHTMRVHETKRHTCQVCTRAFSTHPNLRRHIKLIHEKKGEKPFPCELCGRRFTLKANWKDHVNTMHLNLYSIHCLICDMGFRRKKDLRSHEKQAHRAPAPTITGLRQLIPNTDSPITLIPICADNPSNLTDLKQDKDQNVHFVMGTPQVLQAFGIKLTSDGTIGTEVNNQSQTIEQQTSETEDEELTGDSNVDVGALGMADLADASLTLPTVTDMDIVI